MSYLYLGSRLSALAVSLTGTAQTKQSHIDCSRQHTPGTIFNFEASFSLGDRLTMGKSNKFDYSKRGNSAVKLGQIISRNLKKEVDRASKDADKAAGNFRKRSTGSSSGGSPYGTGYRDGVAHGLDLQVPSKDLGDDGICAMAETLEKALCSGNLLLEDVNLSGNGLTTISLARLAPIISLARHDLKTLNLAGNSIKVGEEEEAVQWEDFLRSFKDCFKLRRLDLSGNALGAKAMEIMAKVHTQEPPVNAMSHGGNISVISLQSDVDFVASMQGSPSVDHMMTGGFIKRRAGLRSIPFITLTNTDLDDLGALWLSFILEEHYYTVQLVDRLNASTASSAIATYQQNSNSRGVDWSLTSQDGLYLLRKAEAFREQMSLVEDEIETDHAGSSRDAEAQTKSALTGVRRISRALPGDRRASIRSIGPADGGEHELSELESARKRLQRSLLERYGASKVELWRTALRLVISARILVNIGPKSTTSLRTAPSKFDFTSDVPVPRPVAPQQLGTSKLSFDKNELGSAQSPSRQGTYAATLTAKLGTVQGDRDGNAAKAAKTSKVLFKPHGRQAMICDAETAEDVASLPVLGRGPQRFVRWQEERMKKNEEQAMPVQEGEISSHLPSSLVDLIACFTVSERETQLLSEKQLRAALSWGKQRSNLETEKEWRRMSQSSRTWTLLDTIGCLAYRRE